MNKPAMSFINILGMCFGFMGIQIGFALQTGHFSRVFETLGANIEDIPILWIAAPLTGLIVQPIVGYMSDRTWNSLGRRRPYFFYGAILTTLGLFVMPSSSALWMAAGMLWIIDSSLNITMEPFRAFVGDMLPKRQRATGFAAQSFFIGIGGVIGSSLPHAIAWLLGPDSVSADGALPLNIKMTFYVGATLLLIAVMITVFATREFPPDKLKSYEEQDAAERGITLADLTPLPPAPSIETWFKLGISFMVVGGLFCLLVLQQGWDKELYVLGGGFFVFGTIQFVAAMMKRSNIESNAFLQITEDMFRLPKTMRQLAVVQFFSWFSMFSMWIYANRGIIVQHYGKYEPRTPEYERAADWIASLNSVYFGVAAIVAFALPYLVSLTNRKITHAICLVIGALGFSSFIWLPSGELLWLSMIGVGIVWASILSMPYAILSNALPAKKMGVYMGIFNFFIVIPQLVAASLLGLMVTTIFNDQPIYAFALGAGSFILAAVSTLFVTDVGDQVVN